MLTGRKKLHRELWCLNVKIFSIVDGHPEILMESVMALTQRMSAAQRTELANVLASLDMM